jgi:hypothetical protein
LENKFRFLDFSGKYGKATVAKRPKNMWGLWEKCGGGDEISRKIPEIIGTVGNEWCGVICF